MIKLDTNKHLSLALGHALSAIRIMNKSGNRITAAEMVIDMPRDKWQQTLEYVEHIEAENLRLRKALENLIHRVSKDCMTSMADQPTRLDWYVGTRIARLEAQKALDGGKNVT